ncbi:adenosine kinase [Aquihabitans sp. G128]|uniref:adenosine kinase n=1 Tax=Aquihabitans sp. G128 TaxID=2849779 RepID=UPI0020B381BD|nr:adenosine kinase [Aquihabitans sp. G128]
MNTPLNESAAAFDVLGIGNALVDVLSTEDEGFIDRLDLVKGSMTLIDTERAEEIYAAMGDKTEASGGSAANTLSGVASFGGRAAYIGRVKDDGLGKSFGHDLNSLGVHFDSVKATDGDPTGRCMIVVTPDGERTMNTYLGASATLCADHLDTDLIASARITFLEGYLFDRPEAKEAFRTAAEAAHRAGRKVSLTLSDSFCVERHRDDFLELVSEGVDILFANEDEITGLYGVDSFDEAIAAVRGVCEIAAITKGKDGSVVVTADEIVPVAAHQIPKRVDTTGAGDLYAAGFLFGLTQGRSLHDSGMLGSIAAAAVIGHIGPRPGLSLAQMIPLAD